MKNWLISLLPLFFSLSLQAQSPFESTLSGHIEVGPSFYQLNTLNELLTRPDSLYLPFPDAIFSMGLGIDYMKNRWVLGGTFHGYVFSGPGLRRNVRRLSLLNFFYGTLKVGYTLYEGELDTQPFVLFPTVGVGAGLGLLRTSPSGLAVFNNYGNGGALFDFALTGHWFPPMRGRERPRMKLGASLGYLLAPGQGWELPEYSSGGTLPFSPQGIYFRLMLGLAGSSKI
jgi:hypothetical protein